MTRPYYFAVLLLGASGLFLAARSTAGPDGTDGAAKPPVLRTGVVPVGSLGQRLGDYVTIEGVRLDAGKTGASTLRVDTVNGRKPPEPVVIWVENLKLPKDKRCKLKGYEERTNDRKAACQVRRCQGDGGGRGRTPGRVGRSNSTSSHCRSLSRRACRSPTAPNQACT